jgi:pyruvate kinase
MPRKNRNGKITIGAIVVQSFTPRQRKVRILATLGPASANPAMIAALHRAGADAFRVNMSHGDHAGHA